MSKLNYDDKIALVKEKLGKTITEQMNENFAKQAEFDKKKKEERDEAEKASKEAEAERHAALVLKQEQERVAKKLAEETAEEAQKAREAAQVLKSKELQARKEQALEWINVKKWEAIDIANKVEGYRVGQVSIEKVCKDKGIPYPTSHWFDGAWKIKEQFKEHYNVR